MEKEKIKRIMDACYQAKRIRDMLPKLPGGITSSHINYLDALLRLEEKLKHDTQNLPESLKNDKIKRAVLIQMFNFTAEALDFPIEENRTYENCNREFTTEELKVLYNNVVESALTMGCDDFGKFMDKMLDMSYEELITRPDF